MSTKPKITVVTTLYNYSHYVGYCVKSFIGQDFPDAEMVIVDDCSTDNPLKTIQPYIGDKVRYHRLNKNCGYSHAKNVGIKMARGDVLVMLDADDMLTKNSLSIRYKKLCEGYDFVHGPVMNLKDGVKSPDKRFGKWLACSKDHSSYKLIHAQSVMLKRSIHSIVGLYDETLRSKSDREMWARILCRPQIKVGWVTEDVAIYRKHNKQMHKSKEKLSQNERLEEIVKQKIQTRITDLSGLEMLKENLP